MRSFIAYKYIWKELRNSFITSPVSSTLIMMCIVCSVIFIFFYFGYIHHIEQKKIDEEFGEKSFFVSFYDPSLPLERKQAIVKEDRIKKGEILDWVISLDEKILNGLEITLECKLPNDVVADIAIDNSSLSLATEFIVLKGKILSPRIEESLRSKNLLKEGRYFNDNDFITENLVCLSPAYSSGNFVGEYEYLKDRYAPGNDGCYTIDGKKYLPIGILDSFSSIPDIPVTTINDNVFVKNITFVFDRSVTRFEYETISQSLTELYGDQAVVSPLELKTTDSKSFNSAIFKILIATCIISATIVSYLFDSTISRRLDFMYSLYLCGSTNRQISDILSHYLLIISFTSCFLGGIAYHYLLMPVMKKNFEYIINSATPDVYLSISFFFIIISHVFFKLSTSRRLR